MSKFNNLKNAVPDRILSKPEVLHISGFSSATLWREIQAERFPAPVPISPHRVGFLESEVIAWLRAAKAARDQKSYTQGGHPGPPRLRRKADNAAAPHDGIDTDPASDDARQKVCA